MTEKDIEKISDHTLIENLYNRIEDLETELKFLKNENKKNENLILEMMKSQNKKGQKNELLLY